MLTFETWDIEKLIPYDRNPRVNDHAVDKIAAAIKEYGFRVPIVAKSDGLIVDGHLRFKAARKLGLTEIPVILADDLTEAQIKAFRLSVNKMAEIATWDEDMLKIELQELYDIGYDVDIIGFTDEELEDMDIDLEGDLKVIDESKADDVPEIVENPVIKLGDLIELGNNYQHRLLCGDSTKEEEVAKLMDGRKADMVFTDPPYNLSFSGSMSNTTKDGKMIKHKGANQQHEIIKNDSMSEEEFEQFMNSVISQIKSNCIGAWYISFGAQTLDQLLLPLKANGMKWKSIIVWMKNQATLSGKDYKGRYEPIAYGNFGKEFFGEKYKEEDIWQFQRTLKNDLHPTMKPVPLVEKAIYNSSKTHNIVLDLFLGSGTTMIASENISRKCYGMELYEKYAQVIIQRYVDYTSNPKIKINGVEVDWNDYKLQK